MAGSRHHTGFLLAIAGCFLLVALLAWAQQPKTGGTLQLAWEADVAGMDPRLSPGAQAGYVMGNLFNSLVSIDAELNYVPDLAESWEILQEGKVYVFHLRLGVKFHDGTDFDAEAVRWNYQRLIDSAEKALGPPLLQPRRQRRSRSGRRTHGVVYPEIPQHYSAAGSGRACIWAFTDVAGVV